MRPFGSHKGVIVLPNLQGLETDCTIICIMIARKPDQQSTNVKPFWLYADDKKWFDKMLEFFQSLRLRRGKRDQNCSLPNEILQMEPTGNKKRHFKRIMTRRYNINFIVKVIFVIFSVCAPSTLCPPPNIAPQLQRTWQYVENHHVKILHVRLGVASNVHPLNLGGGGGGDRTRSYFRSQIGVCAKPSVLIVIRFSS